MTPAATRPTRAILPRAPRLYERHAAAADRGGWSVERDVRWADVEDQLHRDRLLISIAYLVALTSTNHMMGILVGPAVIVYIAMTDPKLQDCFARALQWRVPSS